MTSLPATGAQFNVAAGDVAGLSAAIVAANHNGDCTDRIILPPGRWKLTQAWTGADTYPHTGLPMIHGTCSTESSTLEIVGGGTDATIIERVPTAPKFRILALIGVQAKSSRLTISNLTLRGGDVSPSTPPTTPADGEDGGAIKVVIAKLQSFTRLSLDRVALINNRAVGGGAVWSETSDCEGGPGEGQLIDVVNSRLEQNAAAGEGGAIGLGGQGECGDISIENSKISGNTARTSGGIRAASYNFHIRDSSVTNNVATEFGGVGGILISAVQAFVSGVEIRANTGDGMSYFQGENLFIDSSTLSSNTGRAISSGGCLDITSTYLTIVNNRGGAFGTDCAVRVSNSVIARSLGAGGAPNCSAFEQDVISLGGNLDSDGSCNFGEVGDVSIFDPATVLDLTARNNGGPTFTHALVPGGIAIDHSGSCSGFDQRGAIRAQDGNGDGIAACDVGAFELRPVTLTLAATADAYIRTDFDIRRNDNYGLQDSIRVGTGRGGDNKPFGAADAMRALVRFTLPGSPALNLTGAVLETTLQDFDNGQPSSLYTVDAHAILAASGRTPWAEGNGFEGTRPLGAPATLTDPDNAKGVAWAGLGDNADPFARNNTTQPPFDPAVLDSQVISQARNARGDVFLWDIVTTANRWLKGTLPNNGIMLTDVTSQWGEGSLLFRNIRLGSREGKLFNLPNAVNGPVLKLSWTVGNKPGDFTGDQCVDNSDLAIVLAVVRKQAIAGTGLKLDLNADGRVDIADARKLVTLFTNPGGAPCN